MLIWLIFYMETGRVVESIQVLETCKFSFGMALGNYAAKNMVIDMHRCGDEHEQKELLLFAKYHYHILILKTSETSLVPQDILESFKKAEKPC